MIRRKVVLLTFQPWYPREDSHLVVIK